MYSTWKSAYMNMYSTVVHEAGELTSIKRLEVYATSIIIYGVEYLFARHASKLSYLR